LALFEEVERRILETLKAREGGFVSWDELCTDPALDRSAAASRVRNLLKSGYEIEERAGHGIRLVGEPETFSVDVVFALAPGGFLADVHLFGHVGSTNDVASRLAPARPGVNAIVLAEAQTRGKGRHGRQWFSPPGVGLWFSLVLWPDVEVTHITSLGLVASIAVASAVRRELSVPAAVKWPNDVLVDGRKVCGILSELGGSIAKPCAVVGIGINVNQREGDFPEDLRASACSLRMCTGAAVERRAFLGAVLEEVAGRYGRFVKEGFRPFRAEWENLSMMLGRSVRMVEGASSVAGTVLGLADSGGLRICDARGNEHQVIAGDVAETHMGVFRDHELVSDRRLATQPIRTADECAQATADLLRQAKVAGRELRGIVIGSVVPTATRSFEDMARLRFSLDPLIVGCGLKMPVEICTKDPAQVGADRIANAVAGCLWREPPLVVVDLGTATTFDVVGPGARYLGGVICPGVTTSLHDLVSRTARLPSIEIREPAHVIGTDTEECMQSGIVFGSVEMIDGMLRRIWEEMGGECPAIATGGLGPSLVPLCSNVHDVDRHLTLKGLKALFEYNT